MANTRLRDALEKYQHKADHTGESADGEQDQAGQAQSSTVQFGVMRAAALGIPIAKPHAHIVAGHEVVRFVRVSPAFMHIAEIVKPADDGGRAERGDHGVRAGPAAADATHGDADYIQERSDEEPDDGKNLTENAGKVENVHPSPPSVF